MGSCASKRAKRKEEPYMPSLYMKSNECYLKKTVNTENLNNLNYVSTEDKEYYELPDNLPPLISSKIECSSVEYSTAVGKDDTNKILALPWKPDVPLIPPRDYPFNPYWREDENTPISVPDEEKHVAGPFYINQSVSHSLSSISDYSTSTFKNANNFGDGSKQTENPTDQEIANDFRHVMSNQARQLRNKPQEFHRDTPEIKLKGGATEIFNINNQVLAPENSGVRVIFPRSYPPAVKYQIKCKIHTDFKEFANHVSWMKNEWFIGPIPELRMEHTETYLPALFCNHVCVMVPHCVEPELLPYIRVHYSQPELSKYGKVVSRLERPETYVPKVKVDPDECFIVTENYVLIYTRHFTQFICTCTEKSNLRIEGFLFGSQRHVTGEQEVNLRLYLCKPIYKIQDFAQELINREKKLHVGRHLLERFHVKLPFNDVKAEDRLDVTLTSVEGISHWKPPSAPSYGLQGDHNLRQSVWFDELQPCDSCQESSHWSPIEVTRLLVHHYDNRPKQQFRGVSTVHVLKSGEAFPVTTTSLHFTMDLTNKKIQFQPPITENVSDHLGYAFREIALTLKKDMMNPFARELGLREGQIEAIAHRFPDDLIEQKMQTLSTWRNKEGKSASVEKLIGFLKNLRPSQNQLTEELQKFVFKPAGQDDDVHRPFHDRPLPPPPNTNSGAVPMPTSTYRTGSSRTQTPGQETRTLTVPPRTVCTTASIRNNDDELLENGGFSLSTSSSVRTQYGIPETETHENTERKSVEEEQLLEEHNAEEENLIDNSQPVYMYRDPPVNNTQPQDHNPNQALEQPNGGYPNREESLVQNTTPFAAHTSFTSESGRSNEETLNPESIDDNDDEDENIEIYDGNDSVMASRLPVLEEVIEIRDINEDGEVEDDGEIIINVHGKKEETCANDNAEILILADLVLKELKSNTVSGKTCYVHIQNYLDFCNVFKTAENIPKSPQLKSILLHCGFKHSKKDHDKHLKDDIKEAINKLDDIFPEANLYVSAALPCRSNKNRAKIDLVNAAIKEICAETSAEFVDFTTALVDKETDKLDNNMYSDTVSLNKRGAAKLGEMVRETLNINVNNNFTHDLGVETRNLRSEDWEIENEFENELKTNMQDAEKRPWFTKKPSDATDFIFSGL